MMTFLTQTAPILASVIGTAIYIDRRVKSMEDRLGEQEKSQNIIGSVLVALAKKTPGSMRTQSRPH